MSRKRKAPPPATFKPWPCVTLSVDPGESCGVAIFQRGKYVDSSHGDGYDTRWVEQWISNALFYADALGLPTVLILEEPPRGGAAYAGRNVLGAGSVIGCRKVWLHAWMAAPVVKRRRVSVYPQSWRAPLFGTSRNTAPQEALHAGRAKFGFQSVVQADEAAAICIGSWASVAGQVGAVLPDSKGKKGTWRARKTSATRS